MGTGLRTKRMQDVSRYPGNLHDVQSQQVRTDDDTGPSSAGKQNPNSLSAHVWEGQSNRKQWHTLHLPGNSSFRLGKLIFVQRTGATVAISPRASSFSHFSVLLWAFERVSFSPSTGGADDVHELLGSPAIGLNAGFLSLPNDKQLYFINTEQFSKYYGQVHFL